MGSICLSFAQDFNTVSNNNDLYSFDYEGCIDSNTIFAHGEKVTYVGAYNWGPIWINAGEASFEVEDTTFNGKDAFHLAGYGSTFPGYDKIFKVRDDYHTIIDKNTNLPLRFIRNVQEGGFKMNNQYTFDHEEQSVHVDFIKRQGKLKASNETLQLPSCAHDVLSAVFFVRNIDFENLPQQTSIPFQIFLDKEIFNVDVVYHGIEKKKVKRGESYWCHKLSFALIEGTIFEADATMFIWATADGNKLPVMVESPLTVGNAKFYMTGYEGLRHPIDALIEN